MTIEELEAEHPFVEIDYFPHRRTWWEWLTTSQWLFWNWPNDETLDN